VVVVVEVVVSVVGFDGVRLGVVGSAEVGLCVLLLGVVEIGVGVVLLVVLLGVAVGIIVVIVEGVVSRVVVLVLVVGIVVGTVVGVEG